MEEEKKIKPENYQKTKEKNKKIPSFWLLHFYS